MKKIFTYFALLFLTSAFGQTELNKIVPPNLISPLPSINVVKNLIGPSANNNLNATRNNNSNDTDNSNCNCNDSTKNQNQINKTQNRTNQVRTNSNDDRENENDNDGDNDRDDSSDRSAYISLQFEDLYAVNISDCSTVCYDKTSSFVFNYDFKTWNVRAGNASIF